MARQTSKHKKAAPAQPLYDVSVFVGYPELLVVDGWDDLSFAPHSVVAWFFGLTQQQVRDLADTLDPDNDLVRVFSQHVDPAQAKDGRRRPLYDGLARLDLSGFAG